MLCSTLISVVCRCIKEELYIERNTLNPRTLDHTPPPPHTHTGNAASTCKASSVPGRLHLETTRQRHQDVPDVSAWGWTQDVNTKLWVPFWTVLDDASKACALLHHCGCGKACRGNCKCTKAGIKCTILCNCEGGCINNDVV